MWYLRVITSRNATLQPSKRQVINSAQSVNFIYYGPCFHHTVPSTSRHRLGLVNRYLNLFTPNLFNKNVDRLRWKNPLRGELKKLRYFPNETANREIEGIIDISAKSCLKSCSNKSCADARGAR